MKLNRSNLIVLLAILSAVIYNSWPLGYILNPKVAGAGLASDFEAVGQPYNWLFVTGDIISGLILVVIAIMAYKRNKMLVASLIGYLTFGIMTAVSALIPLDCNANPSSCGYSQVLGWHNVAGGLSYLGLFIAMLFATLLVKKMPEYKWNNVLLWVWSVCGLFFLLSAIPTINNLKDITTIAVIWQDIFLIFSGALVVLSAYSYLRIKDKSTA